MADQELVDCPARKRRKLDAITPGIAAGTEAEATEAAHSIQEEIVRGINRTISPPPSRRKRSVTPSPSVTRALPPLSWLDSPSQTNREGTKEDRKKFIASPIQLTRIRDLSAAENVDTVRLEDILGDPLIKECWNFNFLFDLDFVMSKFDADVRDLVELKIVHGFWKKDDDRRAALLEAAERYANVELVSAYMPDPFGTHHSKMLILLRHDDSAQVVIHTANMIERDWGNMTQAVWRSPLLPLKAISESETQVPICPIGSGKRFELDLMRYLKAYGNRLKDLTKELVKYDFSAIRAAFLGSTPSRQRSRLAEAAKHTSWGWLGLREILSIVPLTRSKENLSPPHIIIQVSSIATLGQTPAWLQHFQTVLSRSASLPITDLATSPSKASSFFAKRDSQAKVQSIEPTVNIIFPTADEIRTSLDGYASGHSIHTKIQSAAQQKQLQYLRPLLCHWKHPDPAPDRRQALRGPAAPHIKTFIRFSDASQTSIDWAIVTSSNFSKQAWGDVENKNGEIWIQSWECGVVVWPDLFKTKDEEVVQMVPVFGKDMPTQDDIGADGGKDNVENARGAETVVGFRMPYDLPLSPYGQHEVPWCASLAYEEPDWKGLVWQGFARS